jgi:Nif-specific regulatory protein
LSLLKSQHSTENSHQPLDASDYRHLIEIGKQLLTRPDVDGLLTFAMDEIIKISEAERGLLILFNEKGETFFETVRNLNKEDIADPQFEISRTLLQQVQRTGELVCLKNALQDPSTKKNESVSRLKLLSVICLPLKHQHNVFGVVYLDNRTIQGIFEPETCTFISELADFISLAAWNAVDRKQLKNHVNSLETELRGKYRFTAIIGSHPKIVELLKLISQVADTDATVLIQGESGTGKELVAQALHYNSSRRDKPFIPINCAALPENLLESELFGHTRGAFTGAIMDKIGWFERADGGTLFLDEIGEMAPPLQVKLLRVLQTGEYSRIGSTEIKHCNVRIIAAASRNLQELVAKGLFREEVYYRLNIIDLSIPPLRERKCDIPLLIRHFIKKYGTQYHKTDLHLSREAENCMMAYSFPGNIRELENIVQRAVVLAEGTIIEPHHLSSVVMQKSSTVPRHRTSATYREEKKRTLDAFEKDYLMECLRTAKGNITTAARCADMDLKNFHVKMKRCGIDPKKYK